MSRQKAQTDYRLIKITFTNTNAASPDFYIAAVNKIKEIEARYAAGLTVADLTAVTTYVTGALPTDNYQYKLTSVMTTGQYTAEFLATV